MSTRATYTFHDKRGETYTVYKHHDGYPEGASLWIRKSLELAWPLPRFEACEFAAAFIAVNKKGRGDVYLTVDRDSHADTMYHYDVTFAGGRLRVAAFRRAFNEAHEEKGWEQIYDGSLPELTSIE